MKNILLRALTIICITKSCLSEEVRAEFDEHHHKSHDKIEHSVNLDNPLDGLVLNNGEKWDMDDHTRTIFTKMHNSFSDLKVESTTKDNLMKVASGLQEDINELIKGCTMTGAAHDQLHEYLIGYIPTVEKLSQSGEKKDAQRVKFYLENYSKYFK